MFLKSRDYSFQPVCTKDKYLAEQLTCMVYSVNYQKKEHKYMKMSVYIISFKFIVKCIGFDLNKR